MFGKLKQYLFSSPGKPDQLSFKKSNDEAALKTPPSDTSSRRVHSKLNSHVRSKDKTRNTKTERLIQSSPTPINSNIELKSAVLKNTPPELSSESKPRSPQNYENHQNEVSSTQEQSRKVSSAQTQSKKRKLSFVNSYTTIDGVNVVETESNPRYLSFHQKPAFDNYFQVKNINVVDWIPKDSQRKIFDYAGIYSDTKHKVEEKSGTSSRPESEQTTQSNDKKQSTITVKQKPSTKENNKVSKKPSTNPDLSSLLKSRLTKEKEAKLLKRLESNEKLALIENTEVQSEGSNIKEVPMINQSEPVLDDEQEEDDILIEKVISRVHYQSSSPLSSPVRQNSERFVSTINNILLKNPKSQDIEVKETPEEESVYNFGIQRQHSKGLDDNVEESGCEKIIPEEPQDSSSNIKHSELSNARNLLAKRKDKSDAKKAPSLLEVANSKRKLESRDSGDLQKKAKGSKKIKPPNSKVQISRNTIRLIDSSSSGEDAEVNDTKYDIQNLLKDISEPVQGKSDEIDSTSKEKVSEEKIESKTSKKNEQIFPSDVIDKIEEDDLKVSTQNAIAEVDSSKNQENMYIHDSVSKIDTANEDSAKENPPITTDEIENSDEDFYRDMKTKKDQIPIATKITEKPFDKEGIRRRLMKEMELDEDDSNKFLSPTQDSSYESDNLKDLTPKPKKSKANQAKARKLARLQRKYK